MKRLSIALLVLSAILFCNEGLAENANDTSQTKKVQKITLKDGNVLTGIVESESADSLIVVLASGGRMVLPRASVESIEVQRGQMVDGRLVRIDPNGSRLFFGPTARAVPAGSGYFSVYELFFPFVAVGIGDFLTLAGGVSIFPGATSQLYYLGPKVTLPLKSETFSLAIGGHYFNAFNNEDVGAGVVYAVTTMGSQKASLTVGAGYGYFEGEFSSNPLLMIGGEAQVSNSIKLISENWFPLSGDFSLLSFGLRFFGESLSADFGFYYPVSSEEMSGFPLIPWLGFTYAFGQ